MFDWRGFQFHQLTQVPRPEGPENERRRQERAGALAASLTGAHADLRGTAVPGAAVLAAWVRPPRDARLRFLYGGRPFFPPAVHPTGLLFPPGAAAVGVSTMDIEELPAPFQGWVSCRARPDALWAPTASGTQRPNGLRGSFDRYVAHLRGPFAWLVLAEPLLPHELEPELRSLVNEILPLSRGEVGEAKRVELERKQARHRELRRAQAGGGWRIRVLVGSVDRRGAGTAAAMLCAATELDGLLYVLEPAPGFPLQAHADLLRALFLAAFEAQEPFPQILAAALTRCYEELGWDMSLGEPIHSGHRPRYPTLADLQRVAADVVTEIGYGKEIAANVHGFIKVRLGSLRLGTAGRFFEGGHPLSFEELCRANVVLQIEDIGDDADKAFLMGAVLMRLSEHLREATRANPRPRLAHLTVIEEAHRLLRRSEPGTAGPAAHAVKIVHRLPAKDGLDSVGATMNVSEEQSRYLLTLVPGEGAVFADGMDRPMLIRVPDGSAVETTRPSVPAPVDQLIGRRSSTCGADCRAQACTLRQVRAAAHRPTWAGLVVAVRTRLGRAVSALRAARRSRTAAVLPTATPCCRQPRRTVPVLRVAT